MLGSKFQDDYMGARPEYQQLMARTRRFLPWPPLSAEKIAANQAKIAAANTANAAKADTAPEKQPA